LIASDSYDSWMYDAHICHVWPSKVESGRESTEDYSGPPGFSWTSIKPRGKPPTLPVGNVAATAYDERLRRTNPSTATYAVGGNIDYTNVCTVAGKFCAFYRTEKKQSAFTLTRPEIAAQMHALAALGGKDVFLQGESILICRSSGTWSCWDS
jgi:hypothetical protein